MFLIVGASAPRDAVGITFLQKNFTGNMAVVRVVYVNVIDRDHLLSFPYTTQPVRTQNPPNNLPAALTEADISLEVTRQIGHPLRRGGMLRTSQECVLTDLADPVLSRQRDGKFVQPLDVGLEVRSEPIVFLVLLDLDGRWFLALRKRT